MARQTADRLAGQLPGPPLTVKSTSHTSDPLAHPANAAAEPSGTLQRSVAGVTASRSCHGSHRPVLRWRVSIPHHPPPQSAGAASRRACATSSTLDFRARASHCGHVSVGRIGDDAAPLCVLLQHHQLEEHVSGTLYKALVNWGAPIVRRGIATLLHPVQHCVQLLDERVRTGFSVRVYVYG